MRPTAALIAGLLAVSGCVSTGLERPGGGTAKAATTKTTSSSKPVAATIIAAMGGGLIGGTIGAGLEEGERQSALEAEYRALEHTPNGEIVTWRSDGSNRYGEVVASQPYRVGSQDCRQYAHTVFAGGQPRAARGTACRNADGSWTPLT